MNQKLIADLARLAARYKAEDWEALAEWMNDPERRDQLRLLFLELAATSRETRPRAGPRARSERTVRLRNRLEDMRATEPERAEAFDDLWRRLRRGELLPRLAAVRGFARALGLKDIEEKRRDQAVTELLEQLIDMSPERLQRLMLDTVVEDRELGEEYDRWVKLIVRRKGDEGVEQSPGG